MFDVGWSEMLIILILALLLFGPKDLITMMRQAAGWVRKAQDLARDFRSSLDDVARETELEEAKKKLEELQSASPTETLEKLDPTGTLKEANSILGQDLGRPLDDPRNDALLSASALPDAIQPAPTTPLTSGEQPVTPSVAAETQPVALPPVSVDPPPVPAPEHAIKPAPAAADRPAA